ncbi:MAG: helix-turn-helix domain-containing protein [Candidatus Binatia bacterium]
MALALLHMLAPMENELEPLRRLLTLKETADVLQLSGRTVHRMVKRKELPAFKVGGQWRVSERQLTKWMQGLQER